MVIEVNNTNVIVPNGIAEWILANNENKLEFDAFISAIKSANNSNTKDYVSELQKNFRDLWSTANEVFKTEWTGQNTK